MSLRRKQYQNAILYLCRKLKGEVRGKKKMLSIEQIEERVGYNPTEVYKCIVEPDISVFNEEEKKMLDRIVIKYGHLNGKQLEELSHAEAPYIGTELRKEIPYE